MKLIRKIIYKFLGLKTYLYIVSKIYITLIKFGFFKKKYAELHFIKKIIKPGDVCIDIGANLGYYTYFLAKATGKNGKIYAVEPVDIYRNILSYNIKKYRKNVTILPYALGKENKTILMGMPVINGIVHHGMTKILDNETNTNIEKKFSVQMKIPDEIFDNLNKLNFIKCDVEGYEYYVFSNMIKILTKHKPMVQCELGNNKINTIQLFETLGYNTYILQNNNLIKQHTDFILNYPNDVYFIHKDKVF